MIDIKDNLKCFWLLIDYLKKAMFDTKSEKIKIMLNRFITFIDYITVDIVLNNLNKKC
nr:MAG: hypothetical protein [uncultured archaeon]